MLVSTFTLAAMSVDRLRGHRALAPPPPPCGCPATRCWAWASSGRCPSSWPRRWPTTSASSTGTSATRLFCWEQWPNQRHKKAYVVCTFVSATCCRSCSSASATPRCGRRAGPRARGGSSVPAPPPGPRPLPSSPVSFLPQLISSSGRGLGSWV